MQKQFLAAVALVAILCSGAAQAKTFRAREMTSQQWSELTARGNESYVVEFRQGDEIPVSFSSEGDLLESTQIGVSSVKVKQTFWMRLSQNNAEMSLDGSTFKPLNKVISGSFTAGAGASEPGIPVNAINLVLKAFLK